MLKLADSVAGCRLHVEGCVPVRGVRVREVALPDAAARTVARRAGGQPFTEKLMAQFETAQKLYDVKLRIRGLRSGTANAPTTRPRA